jgi:hypothetical protein
MSRKRSLTEDTEEERERAYGVDGSDMRADIIPPKHLSGDDVKRINIEESCMKRKFLRLGKVESYVFRKLVMVCLLMVGCAGLSFGGGLFQPAAPSPPEPQAATRETSEISETEATRVTRATEVVRPAEADEVSEVADFDFVPRRNPAAWQASSTVYATPALPLQPETERLPIPVYAISGVRNQEIQESIVWWEVIDIVVELPASETFSRGLVEGADVSDWILNLPAGLEGRAHNVKKGAASIRIYVAGTPTVTAREQIKVKIPGTFLSGGTDLQFVSPTETETISAWEASQTAQQ